MAIHQQNLQTQTFEMFEVKNNLALEIMKNIFSFKIFPYGLGSSPTLQSRGTKTVLYGSETMSSLGQKIWEIYHLKRETLNLPMNLSRKYKNRLQTTARTNYAKYT